MKKFFLYKFFISLMFAVCFFSDAKVEFKKIWIQVETKKIKVDLARKQEQLRHGLMFRKNLAYNEGMIFVYPRAEYLSFWMKNTYIPLSIGFFDENKILIDIKDMHPVSVLEKKLPRYKSSRPSKYALEMNLGWFKKNNIQIGSSFRFLQD